MDFNPLPGPPDAMGDILDPPCSRCAVEMSQAELDYRTMTIVTRTVEAVETEPSAETLVVRPNVIQRTTSTVAGFVSRHNIAIPTCLTVATVVIAGRMMLPRLFVPIMYGAGTTIAGSIALALAWCVLYYIHLLGYGVLLITKFATKEHGDTNVFNPFIRHHRMYDELGPAPFFAVMLACVPLSILYYIGTWIMTLMHR